MLRSYLESKVLLDVNKSEERTTEADVEYDFLALIFEFAIFFVYKCNTLCITYVLRRFYSVLFRVRFVFSEKEKSVFFFFEIFIGSFFGILSRNK